MVGRGGRLLAPSEEAREVSGLEGVDEGRFADAGAPEDFEFDFPDGRGGGDELLDVVVAAGLPLEFLEQVAGVFVALGQSDNVGRHPVIVLDVKPAPGQAKTPSDLGMTIGSRQVERVLARVIGHVHHAPEGAQGLRKSQKTLINNRK